MLPLHPKIIEGLSEDLHSKHLDLLSPPHLARQLIHLLDKSKTWIQESEQSCVSDFLKILMFVFKHLDLPYDKRMITGMIELLNVSQIQFMEKGPESRLTLQLFHAIGYFLEKSFLHAQDFVDYQHREEILEHLSQNDLVKDNRHIKDAMLIYHIHFDKRTLMMDSEEINLIRKAHRTQITNTLSPKLELYCLILQLKTVNSSTLHQLDSHLEKVGLLLDSVDTLTKIELCCAVLEALDYTWKEYKITDSIWKDILPRIAKFSFMDEALLKTITTCSKSNAFFEHLEEFVLVQQDSFVHELLATMNAANARVLVEGILQISNEKITELLASKARAIREDEEKMELHSQAVSGIKQQLIFWRNEIEVRKNFVVEWKQHLSDSFQIRPLHTPTRASPSPNLTKNAHKIPCKSVSIEEIEALLTQKAEDLDVECRELQQQIRTLKHRTMSMPPDDVEVSVQKIITEKNNILHLQEVQIQVLTEERHALQENLRYLEECLQRAKELFEKEQAEADRRARKYKKKLKDARKGKSSSARSSIDFPSTPIKGESPTPSPPPSSPISNTRKSIFASMKEFHNQFQNFRKIQEQNRDYETAIKFANVVRDINTFIQVSIKELGATPSEVQKVLASNPRPAPAKIGKTAVKPTEFASRDHFSKFRKLQDITETIQDTIFNDLHYCEIKMRKSNSLPELKHIQHMMSMILQRIEAAGIEEYANEGAKVTVLQSTVESVLNMLSITLEECSEKSIAQKILLTNTKNELEEQFVLIPQTADYSSPSKQSEQTSPMKMNCNRIVDILNSEYLKWKHNYAQLVNLLCKICDIYGKLLPSTKMMDSRTKVDKIQLDNSK